MNVKNEKKEARGGQTDATVCATVHRGAARCGAVWAPGKRKGAVTWRGGAAVLGWPCAKSVFCIQV